MSDKGCVFCADAGSQDLKKVSMHHEVKQCYHPEYDEKQEAGNALSHGLYDQCIHGVRLHVDMWLHMPQRPPPTGVVPQWVPLPRLMSI